MVVFHHQVKYLEVRQKYSAARHIFNSLLNVSYGDETLSLMLDILHTVPLKFRSTNESLLFSGSWHSGAKKNQTARC